MSIEFTAQTAKGPDLAICLCRANTLDGKQQPWGEERMAIGLAKYLTHNKLCKKVAIYQLGDRDWSADYVLSFHHGLYTRMEGSYIPKSAKQLFLWVLLGWEDIDEIVGFGYDHILCSSKVWSDKYNLDYTSMCYWDDKPPQIVYDPDYAHDLVFVGNGNCHRNRAALLYNLRHYGLVFYGAGWDGGYNTNRPIWMYTPTEWSEFCAEHYAGILEPDKVETVYGSSDIVLGLTQHLWRKLGMITTRTFEALACNAIIVHDYFPAVYDAFSDMIMFFRSVEELVDLVKHKEEFKKPSDGFGWLKDNGYTIDYIGNKITELMG